MNKPKNHGRSPPRWAARAAWGAPPAPGQRPRGAAVAHKTSRKNRMGKSMGKCGENQGEIYGKMWGRCLLELQKANKSGRIADVPARTPEQKS